MSSLGTLSLPLSLAGTSVPLRFDGRACFRSLRGRGLPFGRVVRFVQPSQPGSPVIPPAGWRRVPVPRTPSSTRLTRRSSERRGASVPSSLLFFPPSLSLGPLGPATLPLGCFEGMSVPVPPQSSVFPFVLSARPSFAASQSLRSSIPGGSALIPPPEFPSIAPAVQRRSVGGRPNHALQRTEAGRRGFPRFHVLRGQPLSLSLSSLGPESLPQCSSRARWFPFLPRHVSSRSLSCGTPVPVLLPARPSFGHVASPVYPFPAAVPVVPPPESTSVLSGVPEALCRRVA